MSRISAARRSKSFAPAQFNAFIKKERPSWTAQYALPTQDEENHSADDTNKLILTIKLKHRKMGNRAADLARLREESTDLQARIERFKVVAHEAAAKAQMINSGALTLRARHAPSISAITRPPPRHRACWPSSVSYRCTSSTSAQRARRQLSPVAAPAPPHPVYLTKTESKHTLSLGDFLATIPGEHRANTLRKRKAASPPARGEEEESVAKEEAEAILSSPVLKRRLQDALLAQIEADRETTSVTISIMISSTSAAGETDTSRPVETSIAANEEEGEEQEDEVVAAVEEVVVLERNTRTLKSADKHVDEGILKRKDIVVRKKKKKDDVRDEEEEDADELKRRGKKRKTASAFLASIINPKKKMKKSKRARKERESVADEEAKEKEKKVNMAAAIIEQEKHDQRVAYIKRKIEERYGVVRREAKLSGKRVRIQEPNAAAVAVPQPPSSEGKQTGEAREKVVCNETTVEGGGRRRRAVTVEEVASEMASAIAGARQPLIKQRGVILLDKENLGNVVDAGETKKEAVLTKNNKTNAGNDDTKVPVSSAGGRGVYVPRRPLQPRN